MYLAYILSILCFRFPEDGSPPIPKPKDIPRIEAYEWAAEPCDAAALRELLADPDAMRMQALVLRERILGESIAAL